LLEALCRRESLGSTALGRGVALPHARIDNLSSPVGAFLRLLPPVAFDAPDDKPVEFVLALLLPARDPQRQLDLLAAIAEKFSDGSFRQQVADVADPAAAWCLLTTLR
jgi:PTS system nitrogen regulatory IIA component